MMSHYAFVTVKQKFEKKNPKKKVRLEKLKIEEEEEEEEAN